MVAGIVLLIVVALGFLTLYLPALQASRQGNTVHVQDLTIRLTAQPDASYKHGLGLDVAIEPPIDSEVSLDIVPRMPTMGNMAAPTTRYYETAPGMYHAASDLGMGGLWQVEVVVHRRGRPDAVARFRLNA